MRFLFVLMICFPSFLFAEILVFKNCTSKDYDFEKNDYKLDLKKGQMIREFTYTDETYERLRLNDMRVEKENTSTKGITKENGEIISEISGYPAFYTQMIFDTFDKTIKLKSVLNNTEGISILSNCEKIIKYKLES
jgi:phage terminase large subunit|tara:strand:+ start:226 stop:633 length:408 start_codon:yes stop_codon:yes gene_type:complete